MRKPTKIALIVSGLLMLAGGIMFVVGGQNGGMATICWDSSNNMVVAYKQEDMRDVQSKVRVDAFESVEIDSWTVDVEFIPSDDYYIEYSVITQEVNPLKIEDGKLTFNDGNSKYVFISLRDLLSLGNAIEVGYIKIYYPFDIKFSTVNIDMDMGELRVRDITADKVNIILNMGSIEINNCNIDNAGIKLDMGDGEITTSEFESVNAVFNIGGFVMEDSSLNDLVLDIGNGDAKINSVVASNSLIADIEMGSTYLSLNSINDVTDRNIYGYMLETKMGGINVNSKDVGNHANYDGNILVNVSCDMGDIELKLD